MTEQSASRKVIPWELLAGAVGLIGVLLPVAGATRRVVSFALSSSGVPPEIGAAQPVSQLAVFGFFTVLPGLALSALSFALALLPLHPREASEPKPRSWLPRWLTLRWIAILFGINLVIASVLFAAFPSPLISLVAGYVAGAWFPRLQEVEPRRLPLARAVLFAVGVILAMGLVSGVAPSGDSTRTVDVVFAPDQAGLNGRYSWLGREDGDVYLLPCRSDGSLLTIAEVRVVSMTTVREAPVLPVTPWQALTQGREYRLGFVPPCGEP